MILAVPSETGQGLASIRSGHFGHTPWFTLVEIEDGKVKSATPVKNADHDAVGCGGVIEYVASLGIAAILTAGMVVPRSCASPTWASRSTWRTRPPMWAMWWISSSRASA